MPGKPELVLHEVPQSHPCFAVTTALDRFGLEYRSVMLMSGEHADEIERIYGEGRRTVPALLVDGEPVHGTAAIFAALDSLADGAELYPPAIAGEVREAEQGVSEELQEMGRHLVFGALHFRPEALGTFAGGDPLDPAGVDFAIKFLRGAWRYIGITAGGLAERLERLPDLIDEISALMAAGVIGGETPTAADFQIGTSLHLLDRIGDARELLPADLMERAVHAWFEPGAGMVPAGAFPAGWSPAPTGSDGAG